MDDSVLMITAIAGAEDCAAMVAKQFGLPVEVATTYKAGISALRRREYSIVVLDSSFVEPDSDGFELFLKYSGLAVPLEVNFAISGSGRIVREIRAALSRRDLERTLAQRAAATSIEKDLRDTVAGLLLQSELALAEPAVPPQLAVKLQMMVELAGNLRKRLDQPGTAQ
jgi:hypothetical protein